MSEINRVQFQIEHLGLAARDPVHLKNWYVHTLDAKPVYDDGKSPATFLVRLPGGLILEIYASTSSLPETANNKLSGWRHMALRVESLDQARAELERRGVVFTAAVGSATAGGRALYFADAEGNLLHLVERPPEAAI